MIRFARLLFVLLTTFAATAAGVLDGRVVCMAGSADVAVEQPHRDVEHTSHDHDGDKHGEDEHQAPKGGCTDVQAGGTLVRENAPAVYDHQHLQLALPLVSPALSAVVIAANSGSTELRFAGTPPALADLACVRSIILLV